MSKTLEKFQEMLQDTSQGEGDSDVDNESSNEQETPRIATANCSGEHGCGGTFPIPQQGSDFRFAMLCRSCFKKSAGEQL